MRQTWTTARAAESAPRVLARGHRDARGGGVRWANALEWKWPSLRPRPLRSVISMWRPSTRSRRSPTSPSTWRTSSTTEDRLRVHHRRERAFRDQRLRRRLGGRGPRLHGDKLPGAYADARDPAHSLGHAAPHLHGQRQPRRVGPLNIWNDHTDIMPQRDSGWISSSLKTARRSSTFRSCLQDRRGPRGDAALCRQYRRLPAHHMIEPSSSPARPKCQSSCREKAIRLAAPGQPDLHGLLRHADTYTETVLAKETALRNSKKVIAKVFSEWAKRFRPEIQCRRDLQGQGRRHPYAHHGLHGRDGLHGRRRDEEGRQEGGLVKLRLWRPFRSRS